MTSLENAPEVYGRARRGRGRGSSKIRSGGVAPYLLISPAVLLVIGVLGIPVVELVILSFQNWAKLNPFSTATSGTWTGFKNYSTQLTSGQFWSITVRTIVLTAIMVGVSMLIGLLLALLMQRISTWARNVMTFGLILVWSIPTLVSTIVFGWMFNMNFGVVNILLGMLPHDWFASSVSGFGVIIGLVVWGAVPMITLMIYAGLTQVPKELTEAARVDGASAWQTFRNVVEPIIRPVVLIMTSLSVFWDFQVFTQIWVMLNGQPHEQFWTLGIWSYFEGIANYDYGTASTLATITMLILLVVTIPYLRQLIRIGDAK
jgi:N,N'-diacetylchitobiose transport system permease protein